MYMVVIVYIGRVHMHFANFAKHNDVIKCCIMQLYAVGLNTSCRVKGHHKQKLKTY